MHRLTAAFGRTLQAHPEKIGPGRFEHHPQAWMHDEDIRQQTQHASWIGTPAQNPKVSSSDVTPQMQSVRQRGDRKTVAPL